MAGGLNSKNRSAGGNAFQFGQLHGDVVGIIRIECYYAHFYFFYFADDITAVVKKKRVFFLLRKQNL